jgi:hypothetical protein
MFPVSAMLGKSLVTHTNLGATIVSGARNGDARAYTLGQSLVWLAHPSVNVMLEALYVHGEGGPDGGSGDAVTISPGLRFALDLPGGLQVVPGIAVPLGVGRSAGQKAVLFYLSFEHPFTKTAAAR